MKVTAKFFASVREITKKSEETLDVMDGTTVGELLKILAERYGREFRDYVFEDKAETPRDHLQFLLDGKSVTIFEGVKTKLYDGCRLAIVPPVGGG